MRHVVVVLLAALAAPLSAWTPSPASHFRLGARAGGTAGVCSAPLRAGSHARTPRFGGVRSLLAKNVDLDDGDDWAKGDITNLLSNNAPAPAAKGSEAPKDTDTLLGTGQHFSPQLGEAIEKAVKDAAAGVPMSTVPALAIVFFSSQYSEGGYGRVLPVLLRAMAMHGGKAWRDGVSVIGCSVQGFEGKASDVPGISVTLLGGDNVRAVPFCAGDEAAAWSSRDWAMKSGLKGFGDDEGANLFMFGMPESLEASEVALQALDDTYPLSRKLGGIAGGQESGDERCLIYRKGTAVMNKKGQLIHGEDKETAKYSSSDDLFFDGGSWRKSGLVGAALIGTCSDAMTFQGAKMGTPVTVTSIEEEGAVIAGLDGTGTPETILGLKDGAGLVGVSLLPYDEDSVDPPSFRFVAGSAAPGGGVRLAEGVCVAAGDTVAAAANDEGVGQLQSSLGRLAAAKAVRESEGYTVVGGLVLCDRAAAAHHDGGKGLRTGLKETLNAPVAAVILDKVVTTLPNFPLLDSVATFLSDAAVMLTVYGVPAGGVSEEVVSIQELYKDAIVNSEGKILQIPPRPDVGGKVGGAKGKKRR